MLGYPGSGKTTTARIIHGLTGATHIWADYERQAMFGTPTHSQAESLKLYEHLNRQTELLLADGQSVIFDTSFNFRKDRDNLRAIADKNGAATEVVWVKADKKLARGRALSDDHAGANSYPGAMKASDFERISRHLEPPGNDERVTTLDGTRITPEYIARQLHLPLPKHAKTAGDTVRPVHPKGKTAA